jgi:hypothetical protein
MTTDTEIVTKIETKGLVDAADRILRELIRTPKFKEGVIILLNSIDPPAARSLVRTLFWGDPGLLMSVMSSLPAITNVAAEALAEVAAQMNSMPAPLLQAFLDRVVSGIDGTAAGEATGGLVGVALSLNLAEEDSDLAKSLSTLGNDFGRAYTAAAGDSLLTSRMESWMAGIAEKAQDEKSTTYAFIQAAGKAMQSNPDFVDRVLKPLLAPALKTPRTASETQAKKPSKAKPAKDK